MDVKGRKLLNAIDSYRWIFFVPTWKENTNVNEVARKFKVSDINKIYIPDVCNGMKV